jgi:hypothetical protein
MRLMTSTNQCLISQLKVISSFPLTFAELSSKSASGTEFRAGLRRSYLSRRPVAGQPPLFLESLRLNESPQSFRLKIEHGVCASVRGVGCLSGARGGTPKPLSIVSINGTWHKRSGGEIVGVQHHAPKGRPFEPRPASIQSTAQTVSLRKTGALERVLQATGRCSMRRWGKVSFLSPSTTTPWSYAHIQLKAPEGKRREAVNQDEQGSGVL